MRRQPTRFHICFNGVYPLVELLQDTHNSSEASVRHEASGRLLSILVEARDYRAGVVVNIMIVLVRFFKAFLVQPRMSIVTYTFTNSFVSVIHFTLILVVVMFGFVFSGMFMLGHKVADFADVGQTLLRLYNVFYTLPHMRWDDDIVPGVYLCVPLCLAMRGWRVRVCAYARARYALCEAYIGFSSCTRTLAHCLWTPFSTTCPLNSILIFMNFEL
jgi:hypothetical protein